MLENNELVNIVVRNTSTEDLLKELRFRKVIKTISSSQVVDSRTIENLGGDMKKFKEHLHKDLAKGLGVHLLEINQVEAKWRMVPNMSYRGAEWVARIDVEVLDARSKD